jgi:RND family efflux transporter MFP subunit
MPKVISLLKERKVIIGIILIIVIVAGFAISVKSNGTTETVSPSVSDLTRTVRISGKVAPKESTNLSFETSGTVSYIGKNVGDRVARGDLLVRLDASTVSSDLRRAEADLASSVAELAKLEGATTYETKINSSKSSLIQSIKEAYSAADDAVYNKTDPMFLYPRSGRPQITYSFRGYDDLRERINTNRVSIGEMLDKWEKLISGLNASTYTDQHLVLSKEYMSKVSAYISDIARVTGYLEVNENVTQTVIDKWKTDTLSARDSLNRLSQSLIADDNTLREYLSDVPVQVARVEASKAVVFNYRSQLSKTSLTSPINGLVSRMDAKLGETVTSGAGLVSVISQDYEIETFIPEISISGIQIGQRATVTLDAYGSSNVFEATVSHIDPAETIRDGVSTYRVKLSFVNQEDEIKPGMTANVEIETFKKENVLTIPERTITREGDQSFVFVLTGDKSEIKTLVTTGEKDSKGNIELLSGVGESDFVLINSSKK